MQLMLMGSMTLTTSQLENNKLLANCNPLYPKVANLDLGVGGYSYTVDHKFTVLVVACS